MSIILVFAPLWTSAQAENGLYLGLGGSYAYSDIDTNDIYGLDDLNVKMNFGDTYGFNARLGWRLVDLFALEFNFDYLPGFESDDVLRINDVSFGVEAELDVLTLMLDAKLIPLRMGPLEISFFGGLGAMKAEAKETSNSIDAVDLSADDTLACGEVGLGLGFSLGDMATLSLEGSYVAGFGEFGDYDYSINYFLCTAVIDFHF